MHKLSLSSRSQLGQAVFIKADVSRSKPEEIAEAALWLSSAAAAFVTGLPMVVDGGWTAR
jgi:NAD(P)-dependent dehydrogenase (short-subunit alcohol dehydrogenase family)